MAAESFPELRGIGPQDPDKAGETAGNAGGRVNAITLQRQSALAFPQEVRIAQSLPFDEGRTRTLDLEEVKSAATSVKGKESFMEDDDLLESASVRGNGDDTKVVLLIRRAPRVSDADPRAGRSYKAVIDYAPLKKSNKGFEKLRDGDGDESRAVSSGRGLTGGENALRDAEQERDELRAQLEEAQESGSRQPEPYDGYDDDNAPDIVKSIKEGGREEYGARGLQKLIEYERANQNRSTVIEAAEKALESPPPGE